jgi:DNA-binding TFAR19-related protein (PDSD5 family)
MPYEDSEEQPNNQRRLRKAIEARMRAAELEQQKKEALRKLTDQAAYDRLMNIRLSNQELYSQIVDLIIQLAQTNRINGKLTETQLLAILQKVTYKKEPTMEFKHK